MYFRSVVRWTASTQPHDTKVNAFGTLCKGFAKKIIGKIKFCFSHNVCYICSVRDDLEDSARYLPVFTTWIEAQASFCTGPTER